MSLLLQKDSRLSLVFFVGMFDNNDYEINICEFYSVLFTIGS